MSDVIEKTMQKAAFIKNPTLDDYIKSDEEARRITKELFKN
jgi:1-deoxy-D-xylulose-5-phosphate reductoisomerase